jgi:hypothetical protein
MLHSSTQNLPGAAGEQIVGIIGRHKSTIQVITPDCPFFYHFVFIGSSNITASASIPIIYVLSAALQWYSVRTNTGKGSAVIVVTFSMV